MERLWIAKLPQGPRRSARFARCARLAAFHWGFARVLVGFRWRSWIANLPNDFPLLFDVFGILLDGPKTSKIYAQNVPKIFENFTSTPPKSIPKPPKIEPKTLQNRGLEGIPLEIIFRPQIEPLIFRSWGRLGRPGGVLGASWGRLGAALGV